MFKICLINMPFATPNTPSVALTQLKAVVDSRFDGQVATQVLYLNQDFANYMGLALYQYFAFAVEGLVTGIGDWFFRQAAFPDLADNAQAYLARYYPHPGKRTQVLKYTIQRKRQGIDDYLDELIARYDLDQAAIVGFTSRFSQSLACFALARKLKAHNPGLMTVMGGPNCQSPMGQEIVRHVPQIDFVFSGPALKSFPEFVQHCLDQNLPACNRMDGVFSKANLDLFADETLSLCGEDLDINTIPRLDYGPFLETFESHFAGQELEPILLFETSHGCWWGERAQCKFCGVSSAKMRYNVMQSEKAIAQFESLFQYPRPLYLHCVDNIMPKSHVAQVFPRLDTPSGVVMYYSAKALPDERDVATISRAGIKIIQLEVEALATAALKAMRTGGTSFNNVLCLKHCLRHGVYPVWNILVGFPGEQEAMYQKYLRDIPRLVHLPPPTGVQMIAFERHSPYFEDAAEYGLDLRPDAIYEMIYPFDQQVLKNLAYHFTNHNLDVPYLATMSRWMDPLREACYLWQSRWDNTGKTRPPMLFFKQSHGRTVVYDSRAKEAVEYPLSHNAVEVLARLHRPTRPSGLAEALGHIAGLDLEREMAALQERGLVFEEDGRFINLVLPEEPPPLDAQTLEFLSFLTPFALSVSMRRY